MNVYAVINNSICSAPFGAGLSSNEGSNLPAYTTQLGIGRRFFSSIAKSVRGRYELNLNDRQKLSLWYGRATLPVVPAVCELAPPRIRKLSEVQQTFQKLGQRWQATRPGTSVVLTETR